MIIEAMLIGALGSIPVGPIVIFTLERTLSKGRISGMAGAFGAIVSDTIFAALALFAFGLISDYYLRYTSVFQIVGGAVILTVGLSMLFKKMVRVQRRITKRSVLFDSGKSLLMGLTNPGSFLWILAAFAACGFNPDKMSLAQSALVVAGVFTGSFLYWYLFTWIAAKGKKVLTPETLLKVNRGSGIAVALFGMYFIVKGLFL